MADIGVSRERFSFDETVWAEEVARFDEHSIAFRTASQAREAIERGDKRTALRACDREGVDGTRLPGCGKVYAPLDTEPSRAPYGFVFAIRRDPVPDRLMPSCSRLANGIRKWGVASTSELTRASTAATPTSSGAWVQR